MIDRCENPNNDSYHRYGGRGIKVCQRWKESYLNFIEDMGKAPTKNHSIDRIDPNGNYEPKNCRWSTQQIQAANQSKKKNTTSKYKGVTFSSNRKKPWKVGIRSNGIMYNLGYFKTENEAGEAYNKKAIELYGHDIYLNKID
jgi:hypothetical protein